MQTGTAAGVAIAVAALCVAPRTARAQNAADIINTAIEKYEQRMKNVQNYTVVTETFGNEFTMVYERRDVDGHLVYVPRESRSGDARMAPEDPYGDVKRMAEQAKYTGRLDIDGVSTYAIRFDDPQDFSLSQQMSKSQGDAQFAMTTMDMWVDPTDYVIRRMKLDGTITRKGKSSPFSSTVDLTDYREVEGMLHPFRTIMRMEGVMAAADMSEEDVAKARESLKQFEEQMAKAPEAQRKMMERMMGGQLEKMRKIVESGNGEFEFVVKKLEVNTDPSR